MAGRGFYRGSQGGLRNPVDTLGNSFQGPSIEAGITTLAKEEEFKVFTLECREKKGRFGKVTIWENVAAPGKTLSEKAPKYRGEIRIGDYSFPIQLWGDAHQGGCFTGGLARN